MSRKVIRDVVKSVKESAVRVKPIDNKLFMSTGHPLFNCMLSDNPFKGWQVGSMVNLIGDSSAGKTFLALTALAEVCCDKRFDDYDIIYDDAEHRNSFDMKFLFGDNIADRVKSPGGVNIDGHSINSRTVDDFKMYIYDRLRSKKPCIYVVDSWDSMTTETDTKKFEEEIESTRKDKEIKGTYGMAKAKAGSTILREICSLLETSQSILIIVSQTRDNVGISFAEKTRSGGKALKFYADHEMWLAKVKSLKKTVNGKLRTYGVTSRMKVKKNSVTGKEREGDCNILYDYGMDAITSCIDYLIAEKWWFKSGKGVIATEFQDEKFATIASFVSYIEDNNLETKLAEVVGECWNDIEDKLKTKRKRRFK